MFRYGDIFVAGIVLLLACTPWARAQSSGGTTATVIGTVKDAQGSAIGGASLTARQIETNLTRTTQSNEDGSYVLLQLPPGNYELTCQAGGFVTGIKKLQLTIGLTALADFPLETGGANEIIEVKATLQEGIQPDKTEKSTTIETAAISALPINRRNFLDFTLTTAGVSQDRSRFQGAQATSGLNFNGQNPRQNNVTIDGIDNNDIYAGSVRATYSQEAVKEFQVVSNSFSAEYGRASGGVVNIVTKTGSNDYHGSLFFFNRNDALSARNTFSLGEKKPPFDQYQFGATLSGPVRKDRVFYFAAFERLTIGDTINVSMPAQTVISANRLGFPVRNGNIPFSETAATLLARTDVKVSDNDQLALRYNFGRLYNGALATFGDERAESQGGRQRLRDDNISIANTYVSTGLNLVNETRFLFGRRDLDVDSLDPRGGPRLQLNGALGRDPFLPSPRKEFIYEIVNNVSLLRGRHQLKFGVDYLHVDLPEEATALPNGFGGQATFGGIPLPLGAPALSGLQAFDPALRNAQQQAALVILARVLPMRFPGFPLLDLTRLSLPQVFLQGFGDANIGLNYDYVSAFVQDDIRIRPNLIAKLGVRYDREDAQYLPDNDGNFSPRVGIAYQPFSRLKLHASYGIFHGTTPFTPVLQAALSKFKDLRIGIYLFPFSIVPFSLPGNKFPESKTVPTSVPFIRQLGFESEFQPDFRNGYAQQVHTGFDLIVARDTIFSASYQYVRGIRLVLTRDINPVVRPVRGDVVASRVTGRIDPRRGTIQNLESNGDSYYNALTLEARRRFASNFGLLVSYTFAKAIDTSSDYRFERSIFQNPLNLRGERGLSPQDVRHRFVLSALAKLDIARNALLRDYQLSTIVRSESGQPYYVGLGFDRDMNGDLIAGDRPEGVPRNAGELAGFATVDLRLTRTVRFKERFAIEALFEAFNLFNRVNLSPATLSSVNRGTRQDNGRFRLSRNNYGSAFNPRQLQLGFRFTF